jgi:hypothetical protein
MQMHTHLYRMFPLNFRPCSENASACSGELTALIVTYFADRLIRQVLFTADGQPFFIAGSGTLGWDQAR